MCRHGFFLQTADWQDISTQCDLSGHCQIGFDRRIAQRGYQSGCQRYTGAWSILWNGPFRYVDMNIVLFEHLRLDFVFFGIGAYIIIGNGCGFLHNIP